MITELEFKSLVSQGYNRIPLISEAFAEALHEKVRRELWAYVPEERLTNVPPFQINQT